MALESIFEGDLDPYDPCVELLRSSIGFQDFFSTNISLPWSDEIRAITT